MPGTVAKRLAGDYGIGVRYGCHCAHLIVKQLSGFTPFQEKFQKIVVMMVPILKLQGFVRVSLGIENRASDVDTLISALKNISGNRKNREQKG
jgi:selenocysteine lyase/cysteine desulfurase